MSDSKNVPLTAFGYDKQPLWDDASTGLLGAEGGAPIDEKKGGEHEEEATNDWASTMFLVVAAVAGVGMLGLPAALNSTGWLGILLMCFCGVLCVYSALKLGDTMRAVPHLHDYAGIGTHAFGKPGSIVAQICVYVSCVGSAIIFLVLIGNLMHGMVAIVPHAFWTLVLGICLIPFVALPKSMGEAKWMGYFAVGATVFAAIASIILALIFYTAPLPYLQFAIAQNVTHTLVSPSTAANGFSVFTFAFGAHIIYPSLYAKMTTPSEWPKAVYGGYSGVFSVYLIVGVIGFLVFGTFLNNGDTILNAVQLYSTIGPVLPILAQASLCIHVATAVPIMINPFYRAMEGKWSGLDTTLWKRIVYRSLVWLLLVIVAIFFPYFLDMMALVSSISFTLGVYILPSLFYWKIYNPPLWEKIVLALVIFVGVFGSVVGIITAVQSLVKDIQASPNPFNGLFKFG